MNKPNLSIIVAGIRNYNWVKLYESIQKSTSDSFEVIFVGPQDVPVELKSYLNIKYIRDLGSPTRCAQLGATLCEGEFLAWAADDGIVCPNIFDSIMQCFRDMEDKYGLTEKNVVVTKYTEGSGEGMEYDYYYKLNRAFPKSPYVNDDWWIFNSAIFYRSYFDKLGGWDCRFATPTCSHGDLAIRTQRDEANVYMLDKSFIHCEHLKDTDGDHAPIHCSQAYYDMPLYEKIHNDPNNINRINIPLDNWKNAPPIWSLRFEITPQGIQFRQNITILKNKED